MEEEQYFSSYGSSETFSSIQSTPEKAKLGKFEGIYSPNHLNRSPTSLKNNLIQGLYNATSRNSMPLNLSPLDKCRTVKTNRTKPMFIESLENCSFEGNQSFPCVGKKLRPIKMELDISTKVKNLESVRVDGPNGLRFNTSLATPADQSCVSSSIQTDRSAQGINPNKAVFTIEPKTSKILIVNNKACSLLGYTSSDLCNMKFTDLVHRNKQLIEQDSDVSSDEGTIVVLSGKVVELVTSEGACILVSLWIRQLENDGPCLVVAESVNAKQVVFVLDNETGTILSCDSEASTLFQCESVDKLYGLCISNIIPSIVLPSNERSWLNKPVIKQKATGRTLDGQTFPLSLWMTRVLDACHSEGRYNQIKYKDKTLLELTIRVTYNVSGLLVVDESGIITGCNQHFSTLIFGKNNSEVLGHPIEQIVPNFCRSSDIIKVQEKKRTRLISTNNIENDNSDDTEQDSCGPYNQSQCISVTINKSQITRDKSSSALCLDKSCDILTHTPTPTQDMVSSFSTEQRNDLSIPPDVTSRMSGISIEEDMCHTSLSKSRSENILHSDPNAPTKMAEKLLDKTASTYDTINNTQNDMSQRLSLDCSKFRNNLKSFQPAQVNDKSSLSLDLCDSNETSADFLTPINETPAIGIEVEDFSKQNGDDCNMDSVSVDACDKRNIDDWSSSKQCTLTTSTPARVNPAKIPLNATYRGVVLHKDGSLISVVYTVSSVYLTNGKRAICVWIALDETHAHQMLASSLNSTADNSLGKSAASRPHSSLIVSQHCEELISGDYSKNYITLKQIGKGAYGCVKLAYRKSDNLLVVSKFILKEKVCPQFWVESADKSGRRVPLEVSLLQTLKHPNIVNVLDVYENEKYFQMVMEKHGTGMDLFEFIERVENLDEPLTSYIFRQIGEAVEYLHSLSILHRDIKDENVIIDNKFQVKLIDFGSATFMSKDTWFSTFYGTTEYCSPEVLTGNKYAGPELEMWSMGITLYVLVFSVNPFVDIEDTIQGPVVIPQPVSEDLEHLLRWMLCKDPVQRCTITQLMSHPWIKQPINITQYSFSQVLQLDQEELNIDVYYAGSSPRISSPAEQQVKEPSIPSDFGLKQEWKSSSQEEQKRKSCAQYALSADAHSDNYSLRSSADILDLSSKPVSDPVTDISSDATGHAACDIDYDIEQYDDSWDECEQDSFS